MQAQGLCVAEIRLGRADTHYYLHWTPAAAPAPAARRARLGKLRGSARQLGWRVHAAGRDGSALQLVFQTRRDNLETGLAGLLAGARKHRLYLVQPAAALIQVACHVHDIPGPWHVATGSDPQSARLPPVHFELFMGERGWAEHMFGTLTRGADGARRRHRQSLPALVDAHGRGVAIALAYRSGRYRLKDIADHFGMHFSEVSALINAADLPADKPLPPFERG